MDVDSCCVIIIQGLFLIAAAVIAAYAAARFGAKQAIREFDIKLQYQRYDELISYIIDIEQSLAHIENALDNEVTRISFVKTATAIKTFMDLYKGRHNIKKEHLADLSNFMDWCIKVHDAYNDATELDEGGIVFIKKNTTQLFGKETKEMIESTKTKAIKNLQMM